MSRSKATPATKDADLAKAAEAYQKAIAINADDSAYHNNYALVLAQQKKFDEAQAELTKAAQIDPADAGKFYFNLGAVYVNTGNLEPAAAAFKKAIDLDPNYAEAYYQYGLSLMGKATIENGKTVAPAGTAEAFQKYLDLAPNGPNAADRQGHDGQHGSHRADQFQEPRPRSRRKSSKFGLDVPSRPVSDRIHARNERDPVCTGNHRQSC